MMDFVLTEEQQMLRDMVREFAVNKLKPLAAKIDEDARIPDEILAEIGELGLFGAVFPEEYGGSGFGEVGYCLIQEEIGAACMSTATMIGAHCSIGTNSIFIGGSEEMKQKYIPDLAAGKKIAAFALTEQGAGSDAFNLKTKAVLDGDEWVINGEKLWITNGPFADVFVVYARTGKGISAFIVEKGAEGFSVGADEKKMGINGSRTSSLSFDNVRIPKENLIGRDGRGFLIAMKALDSGRLGLGAACLGGMKEFLRLSVAYAKERKQFGQPIANFQTIQNIIAEMSIMVYTTESLVYRTANDFDKGTMISRQSAMVKWVASENLDKCADMAMQIFAGMGYSKEMPIERMYRDSRINKIFEGTNEIQLGIIARDIIKKNGNM